MWIKQTLDLDQTLTRRLGIDTDTDTDTDIDTRTEEPGQPLCGECLAGAGADVNVSVGAGAGAKTVPLDLWRRSFPSDMSTGSCSATHVGEGSTMQ
jgi:hypothetical protein